ncbi:hypothetical protein ACA910_016025 [Epithemia clementina (nom. ined.)]
MSQGKQPSVSVVRAGSQQPSAESNGSLLEQRQKLFWNREQCSDQAGKFLSLVESSPDAIQQKARILSLSATPDDGNKALHHGKIPPGSSLLAIGSTVEDFASLANSSSEESPNVLFVSPSCPAAASVLPQVLKAFPSIQWVHCRSAGIDFVENSEFANLVSTRNLKVTNAKGQFSSSLAEYVLFACSYFAKDLPRLMRQQKEKNWEKYSVEELRGKTMGIVGYGDIGRACALLAKAYGMRIVALRRNPALSKNDPLCDKVYDGSSQSLQTLFGESDFIVCAAPSTPQTRGMINDQVLAAAQPNAVFINLGRGAVVDETALYESLAASPGGLKGAALDVFAQEPLPTDSPLWDLPNILISPHNMDQTDTFMHEATEFFVTENLPRFLCGEELLNPVDPTLGY